MQKTLATIQEIKDLKPIKGKDFIELAIVKGWQCIVKKGDFQIGDLCIYFEIGSILYPHPIWDDYLKKVSYKIKTMKMAGTISQGLVLPLNIYENLTGKELINPKVNTNLTEDLRVTKEEPKEELYQPKSKQNAFIKYLFKYSWFRHLYKFGFSKKPSGSFPTHLLPETDEPNVQNIEEIIEANRYTELYITEKLEGQSATYAIYPKQGFINKLLGKKEFFVCSHHTRRPYDDGSNWWKIAKKYDIEKELMEMYRREGIHYAIQGEIVGPGIQGNIYKLDELDFYVFNIVNLESRKRLRFYNFLAMFLMLKIKHVPIVDQFFKIQGRTINDLLDMSDGKSVLHNEVDREGLVIRSHDQKTSFKVRSPKYLLKSKLD